MSEKIERPMLRGHSFRRRVLCSMAFLSIAVFGLATAAPALADRWHHDRGHDWHHHGYYGPPPVVYSAPPVYAPPPVVYSPPGISLGFNFR
jgi:hypothetical protein